MRSFPFRVCDLKSASARQTVFAAAVTLSLGSHALAQQVVLNQYRLDLALVLRSVSPTGVLTDVQTGGTVLANPGSTYRLEVRYRINDGDLTDNLGSRGLCATDVLISGAAVRKAPLSVDQGARTVAGTSSAAPPLNPDDSTPLRGATLGLTELGAGLVSGLIDPFRGGIRSNDSPGNGSPFGNTWRFGTLAGAAPGQNSFSGLVPNNNDNTSMWGIYAFEFQYIGGIVTIVANGNPDPVTGMAFAFWYGSVIPAQSSSLSAASMRFEPNVFRPCCTPSGECAVMRLGACVAPNQVVPGAATCDPGDSCSPNQSRADYNNSGVVSVEDLRMFVAQWFAGSIVADHNLSGSVSVEDVFDFLHDYFR